MLAVLLLFVYKILGYYFYVVVASCITSWLAAFDLIPRHKFFYAVVAAIESLTQPVLNKLANWMPFLRPGMVDLTPIALLLLISLAQQLIVAAVI